ncbi:hypothetical protein V8E36_004214 [Tilletia maclaganii]
MPTTATRTARLKFFLSKVRHHAMEHGLTHIHSLYRICYNVNRSLQRRLDLFIEDEQRPDETSDQAKERLSFIFNALGDKVNVKAIERDVIVFLYDAPLARTHPRLLPEEETQAHLVALQLDVSNHIISAKDACRMFPMREHVFDPFAQGVYAQHVNATLKPRPGPGVELFPHRRQLRGLLGLDSPGLVTPPTTSTPESVTHASQTAAPLPAETEDGAI